MEEKMELCAQVLMCLELKKQNTNLLSPLNLAFVGDAIYEVVIRTAVLEEANAPVNRLNAKARDFVKAQGQARMMRSLLEAKALSEQEMSIYRRGRNAKSYTAAKNASLADYHTATGLETLMGYLYLEGKTQRMLELIQMAAELAGMKLGSSEKKRKI